MNIDDCYPSKYLKASDIGEGKEATVVIARVEIAQMKGDDGQAETKPVVFFRDKTKGMTLNMTNKNTIKRLYGAETDNWIGKSIRIGTSWVDSFGDQILALRIRPVIPAPVQAARGPIQPHRNGHAQYAPVIPVAIPPAEEDHGDAWEPPLDEHGNQVSF
jgi:hypothetical protein